MKRFAVWFALCALVFSSLIFIVDLMSIFRRASTLPNIRTNLIIKMGLMRMPYLFENVEPIVILIATMLCVWSLNRRNELIIIKSVGGSFRQILLPMVLLGFALGALNVFAVNPVSRFLINRYEVLETRYLQQNDQQYLISENGIWTRLVEKNHSRIYRIGSINRDTGELTSISILFFDIDGLQLRRRVDAHSGYLDGNGKIVLNKGWLIVPGEVPKEFTSRRISSLLKQKDLEERYLNPKLLSFWQIPSVIRLLEKSGLTTSAYNLYWHAALARIFWLMGMILAGGIFLMRPLREGGLLWKCALTMFAGFFLFTFREVTLAMGLSGTLPVYISAWAPVGLSWFLPLALLIHEEDG